MVVPLAGSAGFQAKCLAEKPRSPHPGFIWRPSYWGLSAPTPDRFYDLWTRPRWVGGWSARNHDPDVHSIITAFAYRNVIRPDIADATVNNFAVYGCDVMYLDVVREGFSEISARRLHDGVDIIEFFTEHDVIETASSRFSVTRDQHGFLRVNCQGSWLLADYTRPVVKPVFPDKIQKLVLRKAQWQAMCLTSEDPVTTALLSRMKSDEAALSKPYSGADPEQAGQLAATLAARYPKASSVCGSYAWGFCYSCGAGLPGRMKQRICKGCVRRNSPLGRLVAEGMKVTSIANPVLYPGVVWTRTRHPRLKAGVETNATDQVFQYSHQGRPLTSSRRSVTAHASAVSALMGRYHS